MLRLRLWFAGGVAIAVSFLTLAFSLSSEARMLTVVSRTVISGVAFGVIGFFVVGLVQNRFLRIIPVTQESVSDRDIASDAPTNVEGTNPEATEEKDGNQGNIQVFQPFKPENLEQIYSGEK